MSSAGTPPSAARFARIAFSPERIGRVLGTADVGPILEQIVENLHPKQRAFALDESLLIAALVGRGGGKTTGGRARFLIKGLQVRKARLLYIATTRPQAEEFMWGPLKDLSEKLGLGCHFSESRLRMTFPQTGATLRLVGADDKREIEKLRGQPFHEVQIDEAASHKRQILDYLIDRIIRPRLGDFGGALIIYGTPGHILDGRFYDATRSGTEIGRWYEDRDKSEDWLGWSSHHWTIQDGAETIAAMARLWAAALRTKKAECWSDDNPVFRREYLGLWAADDTEAVFRYAAHTEDGELWNRWNPERDRQTGMAALPPGDWIYTYGMDMGHADPFALQVFAHEATGRELRHVYEFSKTGMYARTIAELLVGKAWVENILSGRDPGEPGGIIGITGWPYGMVADVAGLGGAMLEELASVYGVPIDAAEKKHKFDNVELFNGDLIDGRIKILEGSTLEDQLLNLQWATDDWGGLKEHKGQRNDCTDAAIYARRKAMHLLSEAATAKKAPPGSQQAMQEWLDADETAAAKTHTEDEELFADGNYDEHYY